MPVIQIVTTIIIALCANAITDEANMINRKSEPLIYHVVESSTIDKYIIDYYGEKFEIPCKSLGIKVEQGVIDVIRVIVYDGENLKIFDQPDYDFIKQFRMKDYTMDIEVEMNKTDIYNGILYDYFFVYIKSGDGLESVDLVYTRIDIANKSADDQKIASKMEILKVGDENKEDIAYYQMIEAYRDLQNKFSELLQRNLEI